MSLYEKAIAVAIEEISHQMSIENCKRVWTKWVSFQKDRRFIEAKERRKEFLTKK